MSEEKSNLVQVIKKEIQATIINLDEDIKEPSHYRDAFQVLRDAEPGDQVILEINSPGGYLSTACQFYAEILSSKARVHANVIQAFSAAALIALSADSIASHHQSVMLIHQGKGSVYWEEPDDMRSYAEFFEKRMERIFKDLCEGFLTKKEIRDVLNKKELWLDHEEILRRSKRWVPVHDRMLERGKMGTFK
jgi:ATP-dependent protease ClpP protease subunit